MNLTLEQWKKLAGQRAERCIELEARLRLISERATASNMNTGFASILPDIIKIANCDLPKHNKTECCGYAGPSHLPFVVMWNPHNQVVQCHNCGTIYDARNSKPASRDSI